MTALREIVGGNKSKLKKPSATLEFVAVNPETSADHSQAITVVKEGAQCSNAELTSSAREKASTVVGAQGNVDTREMTDVGRTV